MIQKISDKYPKIEKLTKSSVKHFEKFWLFVIGCIFALFWCCTPKSSIGSDFGVKPKNRFFQIAFFAQFVFFAATLFSPTQKQWNNGNWLGIVLESTWGQV